MKRADIDELRRRMINHGAVNGTAVVVLTAREVENLLIFVERALDCFDQLKHDPRDEFVRVGGFHAGWDDSHWVSFTPYDAETSLQGNDDPLPNYAVRVGRVRD